MGTGGIWSHLEEEPQHPCFHLEGCTSQKAELKGRHFPSVLGRKPGADPGGSALWSGGPPGEAGDGVPSGEADPRWVDAAGPSRDAPGEGDRAPAGPVPARGGGGGFTPRPADWLRVAMSGGVCSILSVCAAGVTSGRRGGACVARRPCGLEAAGTLHLIYSSGFSRGPAAP